MTRLTSPAVLEDEEADEEAVASFEEQPVGESPDLDAFSSGGRPSLASNSKSCTWNESIAIRDIVEEKKEITGRPCSWDESMAFRDVVDEPRVSSSFGGKPGTWEESMAIKDVVEEPRVFSSHGGKPSTWEESMAIKDVEEENRKIPPPSGKTEIFNLSKQTAVTVRVSGEDDEEIDVEHHDAVEEGQAGQKKPGSDFDEKFPLLDALRRFCGSIVDNSIFQLIIVILIVINAIMMGIGTFDVITENPDATHAFEVTDKVFLIIFTVELGLQFIYRGWHLFTDSWLVFDFTIVVLSWALESVQVIRAFRVFRAMRLVTRLKTLRNIISALAEVLPRMAAISCLLLLLVYIFAVLFTQLFKDLYKDGHTDRDYFGRLDITFFTLFQFMTLEDWGRVARQAMAVHKFAWAPILAYIALSSFIVYNLIIAVVCDAVKEVESLEKDSEKERTAELKRLRKQREAEMREDTDRRMKEMEAQLERLASQQQFVLERLKEAVQQMDLRDHSKLE